MHDAALAADLDPVPNGLAAALRLRVHDLHAQAERSGIVADILQGRADRAGYALLLRNLLPAYDALEQGLEQHRDSPALRDIAVPGVYRAASIRADLHALGDGAPVLDAGRRYAERILAAQDGDGARLIAHAYARYMGDLSGGQTMRRLLAALGVPALSTYDFPGLGDAAAFKAAYRCAIDRAGSLLADPRAVIEEAAIAFTLNIDLSVAVQQAVAAGRC